MSAKTNLTLDLIIFVAFLFIASPRSTGNTVHEWLSTAFIATLILHLLFHWKWIVNITTTFFKKLFHHSRLDYIVDLIFLIAMTGALFTGFMISRDVLSMFGLHAPQSGPWRWVHGTLSDLALIALGIHVALHWKWIVSHITKYISKPVSDRLRRNGEPKLAPVPVKSDEQ